MANRYWVAGGDGNWSSTSNWSASSGGASGASVPGTADAALFDALSGNGIATLDTSPTIQTINFTGFTGVINFGTNTLSLNTSGTVFTGATTMAVVGTPKVLLTYSGAAAVTVNSGGVTEFNSISFVVTAGSFALTLSAGSAVRDLDFSNGATSTFVGSIANTAFTVYGSLTLKSGMTVTAGVNAITFASTNLFAGTKTITTAGLTLNKPVTFNGVGGIWQLQDNLNIGTTALAHTNGTVDYNSKNVTAGTVTLGGGTTSYVLFGTGATWTVNGASFTGSTNFVMTGTATVSMTSASAKTFAGGSVVYPITINQGGAGALTFTGNNAFNDITNTYSATGATTVTFTAASYTKFNAFNLTGTVGKVCTLNSTSATQAILKIAGGVWNVGANSTNVTNNTNLNFVAGSIDYLAISNIYGDNTARYWVGGTASWDATVGTKWAATSGGAGGRAVPTVYDDVYFDANSGASTVTLATATGTCASLICTGFTGTLAGSIALTVQGGITLVAGMTFSYSGAITFTAQTGATNTITSAGKTFAGALTFGNNWLCSYVTWTLQDAMIASAGITVTNGTFATGGYALTTTNISSNNANVRGINLGASTLTLSGTGPFSFATTTNMTFNAGTSTANLTSTTALTISAGSSAGPALTFYNVYLNGTTAATHTIAGALYTATVPGIVFNNLRFSAPATAGVMQIAFSTDSTVNGTLSTTGTAGNRRVWIRSNTYGLNRVMTVNSAPSLTDADFRDMYFLGTAAPISGTRVGDLKGNIGLTPSTPKTVYWVTAAGGSWSGTNWSNSAGGAANDQYFPLAQDTATFVNTGLNTSATVTWDALIPYGGTVDMSGRTNAMTLTPTANPTVYGDWKNFASLTLGAGSLTFSGRNTQTITSSGKTFSGTVTVDSYGGTVVLNDALSVTTNVTVTNGTFNTQNYNVTAAAFTSNNSNIRSISLGSSTVTLTSGTTAIDFNSVVGLTFSAGTSSVVCSGGATTVNFGAITWYNVSFTNTSATTSYTRSITGAATFSTLTFSGMAGGVRFVNFSNNITITTSWALSGTSPTTRVCFNSDTTGTQRTITVAAVSGFADADFSDIVVTGAAAPITGTRLGDIGNNSGITFPSPKTVYWNLAGTQNWSATAWASSSGGVPDVNNFPLSQDTAVFDNTGSAGTVNIQSNWNISNLNMTARTTAMTISITNSVGIGIPFFRGNVWLGTGVTNTNVNTLNLYARRNVSIISNGVVHNWPWYIYSVGSTISLGDAFTAVTSFTFDYGIFDAVSYNVTMPGLSMNTFNGAVTIVRMGNGLWSLTGTGSIWSKPNNGGHLLIKNGADVILTSNASVDRSAGFGDVTEFNKWTIGGTTGVSNFSWSGNSTYWTELASTKTVAFTLNPPGGSGSYFQRWTITGTAGNVVTITGAAGSAQMGLRGGPITGVDYLAFQPIWWSGTISAMFYAGANSTGAGGAVITAAASPRTLYWVGGTGNWSNTARWSLSSGGAGGVAIPTDVDNVIFNSASSAGSYTVTIDTTAYMNNVTVNAPASGTVTLSNGGNNFYVFGTTAFFAATGVSVNFTAGTLVLSGNNAGATFTPNGLTFAGGISVSGWAPIGTPQWTMVGSVNVGTGSFGIGYGGLDTGGYAITAGSFGCNFTGSSTILLRNSTITLSGTGTPLNFGGNNISVDFGTSSITLSGAQASIASPGLNFYNVSITGTQAITAGISITGNNTFNNLSIAAPSGTMEHYVSLGGNQTINGTLTLAGASAVRRIFVYSSVYGTQRTLSVNAWSASPADVDFRDIAVTGAAAPVSITRGGDCGGNSGITFPAAKTVYWNLAGTNDWSATGWATSSGGVPDINNFPLAQDTAVIDNSSAGTTLYYNQTALWNISGIDASSRTTTFNLTQSNATVPLFYGAFKLGSGIPTTLNSTYQLIFAGSGTQDISSANSLYLTTQFQSRGTVRLVGNWYQRASRSATLYSGGLNLNGYNFSSGTFVAGTSNNSLPRTLTLGSGTVTLFDTGTVWNMGGALFTFSGASSTIVLADATATGRTFNGNGFTYGSVVIGGQFGISSTTFNGNNTYTSFSSTKTVSHTVSFGTTTNNFGAFAISGSANNRVTITGSNANFVYTGAAVVNRDYLLLASTRAYPLSSIWSAGANSFNGGNLGWAFASAVVVYSATITETATGSDTISVKLAVRPQVSETATGSDAISASFVFTRAITETSTITDVARSIVQFAAQVTESATGADVDAAIAQFKSTVLNSSTASDVVDVFGSNYTASTSDSASGADSVAPSRTTNPAVFETGNAADALISRQTSRSVLQELATALDRVQPAICYVAVVNEQATGSDADAAKLFLRSVIAEAATATATGSSKTVFRSTVAETGTITGTPRVAPSVFNAPVVERGQVFSFAGVGPSIFNAPVVEAAVLAEVLDGRFLWNLIDDEQVPSWVNVTTGPDPTWTTIDDSQDPGWQNINNL